MLQTTRSSPSPCRRDEPNFGGRRPNTKLSRLYYLVVENGGRQHHTGREQREICQPDSRIPWLRTNRDRKSTRLNSSHGYISYAVFCLKKKKKNTNT